MKRANICHLDVFLQPFAGGADDDEQMELYGGLDCNDRIALLRVMSKTVVPNFEQYDDDTREKLRVSLCYFLATGDADFKGVLESNLVPFDAPRDAMGFFLAVWESLFGNEPYEIDAGQFEVVDVADPMELRLKPEVSKANLEQGPK